MPGKVESARPTEISVRVASASSPALTILTNSLGVSLPIHRDIQTRLSAAHDCRTGSYQAGHREVEAEPGSPQLAGKESEGSRWCLGSSRQPRSSNHFCL